MKDSHEEIAKKLMKHVLMGNGVVMVSNCDLFDPKWVKQIGNKAGAFFDWHPYLLNDEMLELIATGEEEDINAEGLWDLSGFDELDEVLDEYCDDGFGLLYIPAPIIMN